MHFVFGVAPDCECFVVGGTATVANGELAGGPLDYFGPVGARLRLLENGALLGVCETFAPGVAVAFAIVGHYMRLS